ncbi:hypothetical protein K8R43_04560 [archaeon]|nr:hypothetical protein [archaeon]
MTVILAVTLLSVYLIGSVTRVISASTDNKDTLIRNSKGNYWELDGDNIQVAIDDLGEDRGTVWVGGETTISSPILLKNNIMVDFQYHKVYLDGDISFVRAQTCSHATVKNARVKITDGHTASIIHLYLAPGAGWPDRVRYNTFENIYINNPSSWIEGVGYSKHDHVGIHLENNGGTNFLYNTFKDIQMHGVKTGIYLEQPVCSGWGNGNQFENIWIDQFETMIWFDVAICDPSWAGAFNQNVFQNVKGQSATYSVHGVRDVSHNGNHFDHVLVWDWWAPTNPVNDWSLRNDSSRTYICAHYISDIDDQGRHTRYCDNPWT